MVNTINMTEGIDPTPALPNKDENSTLKRLNCAVHVLAYTTLASFVAVIVLVVLSQQEIVPPSGAMYSFAGFIGLFLLTRLLDTLHDKAVQNSQLNRL